ncbi:hypothetical protein HK405_008642 [Cladochytrium tenue]|nr:hypothetical protein HK405_008642 [Cladochytrium tenue]
MQSVPFSDDEDVDETHKVIETDPSGRFVRYRESLGSGACKAVYKAFDEEEGKEVAWNCLRVDRLSSKDAQRVVSEISILGSLRNENIINMLHYWTERGPDNRDRVVFITELMTSGTLKSYIRKLKGPLKPKVLKNWCRQILSGLVYLHSRNPPVIHRDLKCENIFINGNNSQAKIGDLGLAAMKDKDHLSSVLGTPEFMAPELYDESYDEKVDIYAFGLVVLELVTREYPYSECANQAQIYKKVTTGVKPQAFAKITDQATREFVEKCIQFKAADRPSASELLRCPFLNSNDSEPVRAEAIIRSESGGDISRPGSIGSSSAPCSSGTPSTTTTVVGRVSPTGMCSDTSADKRLLRSCVSADIVDRISHVEFRVKMVYLARSATSAQEIKFPFNLLEDTASAVVAEMVREKVIDPSDEQLATAKLENAIMSLRRPLSVPLPMSWVTTPLASASIRDYLGPATVTTFPSFSRCESDQSMVSADIRAEGDPPLGLLASSPQIASSNVTSQSEALQHIRRASVHLGVHHASSFPSGYAGHRRASSACTSTIKLEEAPFLNVPDVAHSNNASYAGLLQYTLNAGAAMVEASDDASIPSLSQLSLPSRHSTPTGTPVFQSLSSINLVGSPPPSLSLPPIALTPLSSSPAGLRSAALHRPLLVSSEQSQPAKPTGAESDWTHSRQALYLSHHGSPRPRVIAPADGVPLDHRLRSWGSTVSTGSDSRHAPSSGGVASSVGLGVASHSSSSDASSVLSAASVSSSPPVEPSHHPGTFSHLTSWNTSTTVTPIPKVDPRLLDLEKRSLEDFLLQSSAAGRRNS